MDVEQVNFVQILFSLMITSVITLGSLINTFENYLPVIFVQIFRYGKFSYTGKGCFLKPIQVPKCWFRHFYIYSSVLLTYLLYLVLQVYFFHTDVPEWLYEFLYLSCGHRSASVNPTRIVLAFMLLTLQCYRRLYDTNFVSVYGKNSKMDLAHYLIGFIHYTGAVIAILSEAPKFTSKNDIIKFDKLNSLDVFAVLLFLWAWLHQYKATVILGNLRKNEKGKITSDKHKIPKGDWFNYISSPHLVAEMLMYFALTLLLWQNVTWWFIFVWVLSNQIETALLSHWWYQETFQDFPKHRKALIPFVY